ncbi:MAG: DUF721 domain-containing protein [Bacteroidia bacterium]|nr:DUF721 domain-containing protein [Bacteroidia bacterium]MCZ2140802.1 DUF721 domain-containing protein [Bacteroidia bacterium]
MAKKRLNDQTLSEAIQEFLKEEKLDWKLAEINVINNWEKIVGKLIASQTKNIYFFEGKLILHIESAALKQELNYQRFKIVELVNKEAGMELISDVNIK